MNSDPKDTEDQAAAIRVAVEVSKDRLQAWVRPVDQDDPRPLTSEEIVDALTENKIVVETDVTERINAYVALLAAKYEPTAPDSDLPEQFLVAQGRPLVEGKDGDFLWHDSLKKVEQDWRGDAPINYYILNSIVTVEKDDAIGTLVPAIQGVPGVDVFGNPLPPMRSYEDVRLDGSVRTSDDDPTVALASVAGRVVYENLVLSITEVFVVKGDVDFGGGNIDSSIDVYIGGLVHDLFVVKSKRAVAVQGAVEAATIEAVGDVTVKGGIRPRGKGRITSGSDIVAKFCEEAHLHAAGNVKIVKALMNCEVHCEEKLLASSATLIGGRVYAREGVEVFTIGSVANVPTEIIVGIHPDVIREAEQLRVSLKSQREALERILESVQPMVNEMNRLSPSLRQRAIELLSQAKAALIKADEIQSRRTKMLEEARTAGVPYVLVSKAIHAGVTIRIGRRQTVFKEIVKGPVKVEKRKIEEATEFVAVNPLTGSMEVLSSAHVASLLVGDEDG